jgi:hypothetical protein
LKLQPADWSKVFNCLHHHGTGAPEGFYTVLVEAIKKRKKGKGKERKKKRKKKKEGKKAQINEYVTNVGY